MTDALRDRVGHTPGPWKAERMGADQLHVIAPKNGSVVAALKWHPVTRDFVEANARLIAAAPELLEALTALQRHFAGMPSTPKSETLLGILANADRAIARATGAAS